MRLNKKLFRKFPAVLAAVAIALSASADIAADSSAASPGALTNWLAALNTFRNAGASIGKGKPAQAKTQLTIAATNLAAPYGSQAAQFATEISAAISSGTNAARRSKALIQLCARLHAYDAALRLQSATGDAADRADDPTYAWRLFESGDTGAALAEYRRRVAVESVELYRHHYQAQINLLEQRPANLTNVAFALRMVQQHHLRGLEEKADVLAAIEELHRVLPFARGDREAVAAHQSIIKNLAALGDDAGRDAWEDKLLREFKSDSEACANVLLERGLRAFAATNFVEALPLLRKVCSDFSETAAYGDAQYTVGLILQRQRDYAGAVEEFSKIFPSKVSDHVVDPEKSDDYKNYRHRAALRISDCYEAGNDFARALTYAEMARDRYKFMSYCKTCLQESQEALEKRIQRLKDNIAKQTPPPKTN